MVEMIMTSAPDLNSKTNDGRTPLYTASWRGNVVLVKSLIKAGANVNMQNRDVASFIVMQNLTKSRDGLLCTLLVEKDILKLYRNYYAPMHISTSRMFREQLLYITLAISKMKKLHFSSLHYLELM